MATFDDQPSPVAWGWVRLSTVRRGSVVISRLTGVTEKPSLDDWRALASKDLKGADPDTLVWETPEGISVKPLYTEDDVADADHVGGLPGFAPFVRGPRSTMYAGRPWTIRQYAGFSTAEERDRKSTRLNSSH